MPPASTQHQQERDTSPSADVDRNGATSTNSAVTASGSTSSYSKESVPRTGSNNAISTGAVAPKQVDCVTALLERGKEQVAVDPSAAINLIQQANALAFQVASKSQDIEAQTLPLPTVEEATRLQEQGIVLLASLYAQAGASDELQRLLRSSLPFFSLLAKARTAKLVRILVDAVAELPHAGVALVSLCEEVIAWCQREKRTFLRHRVEVRLAQVYLQRGMLEKAQPLIQQLLQEVKKLDDKLLLVEIHLIESKLQFKIRNYPKARAALTASRTSANAIHCPPLLQGDIDLQAGILAAQDRDYKTAFSYFFEAFEAFSAQDAAHHSYKGASEVSAVAQLRAGASPAGPPSRALQALKYMLLSKILQGKDDEVSALLTGKQGLRYYSMDSFSAAAEKAQLQPQEGESATADIVEKQSSGGVALKTIAAAAAAASTPRRDLEAMRQLAVCHKERSLKKFEETLETFGRELKGDEVLMHHIDELYENLLEKNLTKLLMPFCRVELAHVAQLIGLPLAKVEQKLSEMILDGKLHGTLDQGIGVLLLYERQELPEMHTNALATIKNMAQVVDTLYEKSLQAL